MQRLLALFILKITGWKVSEFVPKGVPKAIVLFAPHTSFSDFYIGRLFFSIVGIKVRFLIKKEVFIPIVGRILKALGGIPVDRSRNNNLVKQLVKKFEEEESIYILIAPEGTRKAAKRWKRGYYEIALQANVPIIIGSIDYKKKIGKINDVLYPSGDYEKDWQIIRKHYVDVTAKYPENFYLPE